VDDALKSLIQQYLHVRKKQRHECIHELGLSEEEADRAVSTLELYYHIEASHDQWAQAWMAAKRDFLAGADRSGIKLADLVLKYVDIARLGGGPESRWT
jgi:hypothetical protein